jgi:hypothetical protein
MTKSSPDDIIPLVLDMLFPRPWLNAKGDDGRTNSERQSEVLCLGSALASGY